MNKPIDLSSHPILQQAFDVIQAIEKCGASVELTNAVTKAGELMTAINELIAIRELKGDQVPFAWVRVSQNGARNYTSFYPRPRKSNGDAIPLFTAPQKPVVTLGHIKISEVVAAVSLEQNRKWNGRVGYMAGWNACIDAAIAGGIVKDGE